ncbi:hypothetical protein PVAP13_8NG326668 [Panicum virgatum]|uniref:Uncharacterized protein n=1 Tax=Panicum virgatum TaxID=38727 RepID=A0A8T0PDC0_PANVG|nr:hypothetical protein PVAP13_8NG326668 [Panicum virgatum]
MPVLGRAGQPRSHRGHRPSPPPPPLTVALLPSGIRQGRGSQHRQRRPGCLVERRLLPSGVRRGRGSQHRRCRPGCLVERRLLPSGSGESRGWAGSGGRGCRAGVAPPPCLPVQEGWTRCYAEEGRTARANQLSHILA